ncbi:MAG: nickel-type superoxide dismutase maturation protease [Candidatus Micrarchaeaceae archaeon]
MLLPLRIFKAVDRSMEPAVRSGEYLFVSTLSSIRPGDIVVAEHPAKPIKIVKRISAISDGKAYLLGDNKEESEDSRTFGSIERKNIIGKVILKI